jgi:hypothetical protein
MAKSLNIVIGADIEKLREGFNKAISVVQSSGKKMSDEVAKSAKSMEERLASIATRNPTMGSVRQLTQLAMEARALGPEFAQVANEIIKQAGRMKDAIADTRGEVTYFASDTRKLDAVLGGIQGVAGGFAAIQGAMALAGVENKNLQATMVKLQGAMALVSGLQAVQNTLQQESAAVQGFLALRTTVLTAAQTAYTTASAGAIGAQRALNIVMAAAPWALAIAAISAVVISIASYKDKITKATREQKLFNEINSETQKNFEEEVKSVSGLLAVVNNHNASMQERKNALAEIQKIYPDFLANQNLDKVTSDQLKTATSSLTNEIFKQAKAKAAFTKLQELSAKMIDFELGKQQAQISTQAEINRLYASGASASQVQGFIESQKNVGLIAAKNAAEIQTQIDAIINMASAQGLSVVPINRTTQAIQSQTVAVKEATAAAKAADVSGFKPSEQFAAPSAPTLTKFRGAYASHDMTKDLQKNTGEQVKIMSDYEQKMTTATDAVNSSFASLQTDAAASFAQFVADTAAGDANAGANFGKSMLGAIANFMQSVGAALVATAVASKAFKELILSHPEAAIAAGIALMAGAAIVRTQLSAGPKVTAFADGGIVSGPTLGLMGEYPGASSNPEVIAPLDKLKGMLKSGDNNSGFIASTSIQGRDLAIVLQRYNKDSARG